jgi:peptidyl-prolyl cis-trans isomerase SurA
MRRLVYLSLVPLLVAGTTATASGQGEQRAQPIDRVLAVVGTAPILASQVEEQLVLAQSQGGKVPGDSAEREALRRKLLDQMVNDELLVQQAQRDTTVKVTDQEIQDQVEKTVDNVRKQFTNELDFGTQLRAAGFPSEEEWRRWLADNQRRSLFQQRLIQGLQQKGKLRPIQPTEAEMRAFWEENRTQRPKHPPLVSFRQIVIAVQPDSVANGKARALAESLGVALRHGANFAEVAKRFSADSASRGQGGELGWFRRGVMLKNFEAAAFRLKPGEISDVVGTPAGYHIIQVERIEPAEIQARHVLIEPDLSPAQVARTHRLADSVHAALAAGASFDSLARRYADPDQTLFTEEAPVPQLPPDYAKTIGKDTVPGLVPPFVIDVNTSRPKFAVVDVTKWQPAGELTFEDVRDRLREQLSQQLAIKHYLGILRRTTYVDVRP